MFFELYADGEEVKGLTLPELLERYSEIRLRPAPGRPALSSDIARRCLERLAAYCFKHRRTSLERDEAQMVIAGVSEESALELDEKAALNRLLDSGLLVHAGNHVEFAFVAFLDFFYAQHLRTTGLSPARLTSEDMVRLGPALAFLVGQTQGDDLVRKAFEFANEACPSAEPNISDEFLSGLNQLDPPNSDPLSDVDDEELPVDEFEEDLSKRERK